MPSSTMEIASATFMGIVEKLTFMFGEPVPKHELAGQGIEFTMASMSFKGDLEGRLSVAVPSMVMPEIAANILGLEPEDIDSKEMLDDALAEMLNVVCGHVIMDLVGTGANFKLNSPETRILDDDGYGALIDDNDFVGFELDDSPAFLGLKLET